MPLIHNFIKHINRSPKIRYIFRRWQWFFDWDSWIYSVRILWLHFWAKYRVDTDIWSFSLPYRLIRYTINTTYSPTDLTTITTHLRYLKEGFLSFNAILLQRQGWDIFIILGPSGNWKTTYTQKFQRRGDLKIIDDDIVFFNPSSGIASHDWVDYRVSKIFFIYNSLIEHEYTFSNHEIFFLVSAAPIFGNELARNILSTSWLLCDVQKTLISWNRLTIQLIPIKNYNYDELDKSIWLE